MIIEKSNNLLNKVYWKIFQKYDSLIKYTNPFSLVTFRTLFTQNSSVILTNSPRNPRQGNSHCEMCSNKYESFSFPFFI